MLWQLVDESLRQARFTQGRQQKLTLPVGILLRKGDFLLNFRCEQFSRLRGGRLVPIWQCSSELQRIAGKDALSVQDSLHAHGRDGKKVVFTELNQLANERATVPFESVLQSARQAQL